MSWKYMQRDENGMIRTTDSGGGGGASTLADLTDVDISSPSNGQILKYDETNSKWINVANSNPNLSDLSDVYIDDTYFPLGNAKVLRWHEFRQQWVPEDINNNLSGLDDVSASSPSNGQVLTYNSSSQKWVPATSASSLAGLSDTSFGSNMQMYSVLMYISGANIWTDALLPLNGGNLSISSPTNGQVLTYESSSGMWKNMSPSSGASALSGLSDVTLSGLQHGHYLMYNGLTQKWINATQDKSFYSLDEINIDDETLVNNQILKYNSSSQKWVAANLNTINTDANKVNYSNSTSGLSATNVQTAIDEIQGNLTASNNVKFKFCYDSTTQKYGYRDGADTFIPFSGTIGGGGDLEYNFNSPVVAISPASITVIVEEYTE